MMLQEKRIDPDYLLDFMGETPADNTEGLSEEVPWKSQMSSWYLEKIFSYQDHLDYLCRNAIFFGPLAVAAQLQRMALQTYITDPIKKNVQLNVRLRKEPDIYQDTNSWIYKHYGSLLHSLCDQVMTDDCFDQAKADYLAAMPQGKERLKFFVSEFSKLENAYTSRGLSRLRAMKTLLECLLVVITGIPFKDKKLPFMKYHPDGSPAMAWDTYLAENKKRFENLYKEEAFDPKNFAERATRGRIGCSHYEIVVDSFMRTVTLRYYPLPAGVKSNGQVLYLSSPLINKPEIFDLAPGKSVIEGLLKDGFHIYMVDYGQPTREEENLGLDFYGKTVHDHYLDLIAGRHPNEEIGVLGYCMGGALILPYLARRAEERLMKGLPMDVKRLCLMAAPIKFDDDTSGQGPMRAYIRKHYNTYVMQQLFSSVNIPPQVIDYGISEIQPGVQHSVMTGFYERANQTGALEDTAPFLFWLTHGTRFPLKAHQEWLRKFFLGNEVIEGTYCLPSGIPVLDGKPVNMDALEKAGVVIFDYRGTRDPIAPYGSCVASETWGRKGSENQTIEKDIGHIFVVSKKLLAEFLSHVKGFFLNP